jgi:enoyl-CoA hydratase/carnithine racemase
MTLRGFRSCRIPRIPGSSTDHRVSRQNARAAMAAESATSPILVRESRVGRIVLRDPKRRNALDAAALAKLEELIGSVARDSTCDVLVIAGEGTAFCAGFDLAACAEEPRTASTLLDRKSVV